MQADDRLRLFARLIGCDEMVFVSGRGLFMVLIAIAVVLARGRAGLATRYSVTVVVRCGFCRPVIMILVRFGQQFRGGNDAVGSSPGELLLVRETAAYGRD